MDINTALPLAIIFVSLYVAFPRPFDNLAVSIFRRKSFVVVLFKRANTDFVEKWLVVPPADKQTKIRKGIYNLSEKYQAGKRKGRAYFLVDEKDNIPRTFGKDSVDEKAFQMLLSATNAPELRFGAYSNDDIVLQAHEVQSTIQNRVAELLFSKQKDILVWVLVGLILINAALAYYEITILREMAPYIAKFTQIDWQTLNNITAPANNGIIINP